MRGESGQHTPVIPAWASADGPANDIVLSTRARLARNIEGITFPTHAKEADLKRAADLVLDVVYGGDGSSDRIGRLRVIHPSRLSEFERLSLVDARVASRRHVDGGRHRPIVLNDTGTLSLMVNEEDHLRIQCILPGLQPMAALQMAQEFDVLLASKIRYARADNYGYLMSSLANIGTGFRLSVMLHLAGLSFLGEAVPTLTAAAELKISIRGLFGEGTKAFGGIFQVSNETTIGFSEKEIASRVRAAAEHLVSREKEARRRIAADRKEELAEAVEQARSRVLDASVLSGKEAMACISILRLADAFELKPSISARDLNELLVSIRLGTSAAGGRSAESMTDDVKRAKLLREKISQNNGSAQQGLLWS
jgi:protein arginine kinase